MGHFTEPLTLRWVVFEARTYFDRTQMGIIFSDVKNIEFLENNVQHAKMFRGNWLQRGQVEVQGVP